MSTHAGYRISQKEGYCLVPMICNGLSIGNLAMAFLHFVSCHKLLALQCMPYFACAATHSVHTSHVFKLNESFMLHGCLE